MLSLLTVLWLTLPLAPYNPIEEDTLPAMSLHTTAGITTPNHIVKTGPELSVKWEMLATHPLVLRAALEYQLGSTKLQRLGDSRLHQGTISVCALYYRGTNKLTGYIGAGPVFRFGHFSLADAVADSLWVDHGIVDVGLKPAVGYRIVLGLRLKQVYSLEVGVTEVKSDIQYTQRTGPASYAVFDQPTKLSSFRMTLGYLFTMKEIW